MFRYSLPLLALLLAFPAHAETPDETFLQLLEHDNFTYDSRADIIGYAHGVCYEMHTVTFPVIVSNIVHDYPTLPREAAERLAADSIKAYCPEFSAKISYDKANGRVQ